MRRLSPQSPGGRACLCVFFFCLVCLCCYVFPPALHNIYFISTRTMFHTPMAQYSLYVLKVPLNTKQTRPQQKLEQEAQLMLTTGSTRLAVSRGQQTCNFVPKMHRFWDIRLQKCRDLENRVRVASRSLQISPCDRALMTSYWRSIVTMALSRVVSEIFHVEKCRDLEIGVKGHSRSLKVVPCDRACMVSY